MEQHVTEKNKEVKKGKKKWLIVLLILILAAIALLLAFRKKDNIMVSGDIFPGAGDAGSGGLSKMTEEEIKEQMQLAVDDAYFSFKINSRPVFADGNSEGDLEIENPNYNVYPMVVEIYMDENGEKLYDSGGMVPDTHIDSDKLLVALAKGTYQTTAVLKAYDPDSMEYLGEQEVEVIMTIEN